MDHRTARFTRQGLRVGRPNRALSGDHSRVHKLHFGAGVNYAWLASDLRQSQPRDRRRCSPCALPRWTHCDPRPCSYRLDRGPSPRDHPRHCDGLSERHQLTAGPPSCARSMLSSTAAVGRASLSGGVGKSIRQDRVRNAGVVLAQPTPASRDVHEGLTTVRSAENRWGGRIRNSTGSDISEPPPAVNIRPFNSAKFEQAPVKFEQAPVWSSRRLSRRRLEFSSTLVGHRSNCSPTTGGCSPAPHEAPPAVVLFDRICQ